MPRFEGALSGRDLPAGIARFGCAGFVTTAFYFLATNGLATSGILSGALASFVSYCLAIVLSFYLQSKLVFRFSGSRKAAMIRFAFLSGSGLILSQALFLLIAGQLGKPIWLASAIVSVAIPIINFFAMNFWVFVERRLGHEPPARD